MGGTGERDELVDRFSTLPGHVRSAAHAAEGQAVPAGEWGPAEIVRHLIAVEDEVWRGRLASVAAEDEPHWAWTEPGLAPGFDDVPLDDVIAAFTDARAGTVEIIRALDE